MASTLVSRIFGAVHAPNRIFLHDYRHPPERKSFPKRLWVLIYSQLRLPRGEVLFYPTGDPNIRILTRETEALGYGVAVYPLQQPDLSRFPPGVWHWAVVLGEFILFLVLPSEPAESSSDQSGYLSEESPIYDLDNIDPENPEGGYGYWHLR